MVDRKLMNSLTRRNDYSDISHLSGPSAPIDARIARSQPYRKAKWRGDSLRRRKIANPAAMTCFSGMVLACFAATRAHFAYRSSRAVCPVRQHGAGFRGRRLSIMSRMRRNRSRGTAISAIWNTA